MKRESKAYSYNEQLEEMQLRRELEEKRRKEGKIKEPQYTPKQLEVIKNQRIKEQAIREKLTKVLSNFYVNLAMICLYHRDYCGYHCFIFIQPVLALLFNQVYSP